MSIDFRIGDTVYDIMNGWGEVKGINPQDPYPISVLFSTGNKFCFYTEDGKYYEGDKFPRLSFTEYIIEGFSNKRIENYGKHIGKWGKFWDDNVEEISAGKLAGCDGEGNPYFYNTEGKNTYKNFEPFDDKMLAKLKYIYKL